MGHVQAAVQQLRAVDYDVPEIGRTFGDLRRANKTENMVGLFVAAHGRCDFDAGLATCEVADTEAERYHIGRLGKANDWQSMVASRRERLAALWVWHCLAEARAAEVPLITSWFQLRTGLPYTWPIRLCGVDARGLCHLGKYIGAVHAFTRYFVGRRIPPPPPPQI